MLRDRTNPPDPEALALSALGWALAEDSRAQRLLALTGLTPGDLRDRLSQPSVLAAILGFLEAHEPDLVACAEALGVAPAALVAARRRLEQ
jgi:adenine/guanine phosphoribosyltransferase-like PRPP-binding protein